MFFAGLHQYKQRPTVTNKFPRNAFDILSCATDLSLAVEAP